MGRAFVALGLLATAALALGGCGTRQTLGLVRQSPDEFTVVAKAPLVLPPDFGLRPPLPGAPAAVQAADPPAQAANILANAVRQPANPEAPLAMRAELTPGENALLGAAGTAIADPQVRARIDFEANQIAERNRGFIERLLWWQQPRDNVLNPLTEAERLRAAGQPTTGAPSARRTGTRTVY